MGGTTTAQIEKTEEEKKKKESRIKKTVGWVVEKIKPKPCPVLTEVPEPGLFSQKANEILEKIKKMKAEEVAEVLRNVYEYVRTHKVAPADAENIGVLIKNIAGERSDAWNLILSSKDEWSKGLIELLGKQYILKYTTSPLTERDAIVILNILADRESSKGNVQEVLSSISGRFSVKFTTAEETWLFTNWLRSGIIKESAIPQRIAALEGRILGNLGFDPKWKEEFLRTFGDNLRKIAEYEDLNALLFASIKDEKFLKRLEEDGQGKLVAIIQKAKNFDELITALKWGESASKNIEKGIITREYLEQYGKRTEFYDFGTSFESSINSVKDEFDELRLLVEYARQYGVKDEMIQNAIKNHTPIFDGEWRKAIGKAASSGGRKISKLLIWPTYKAYELPKTEKGYLKKGGWGLVQLAWLGAIIYASVYAYSKLKPKVTEEKEIEKIRSSLEKLGASPAKSTLEFFAENKALLEFIRTKAPVSGVFPKTEKEARFLLYNPEKGGYYFNYKKINDFVDALKELKKKNPNIAFMKLLNDNIDKFVEKSFLVPYGMVFLTKFAKLFGFKDEIIKYFMERKDKFLMLYAGVLNGSVPLSYVAEHREWALERNTDTVLREKWSTNKNSLMDLLDAYTASGLVAFDTFNALIKNPEARKRLNEIVLKENELVYGDLSALCEEIAKGHEAEAELSRAHDLAHDLKLKYFIGPAEIAKWDTRFLDDPDAARFIMRYSQKNAGIFKWLNNKATKLKAYEIVKYLMGYENLMKTYVDRLSDLEDYLNRMAASKEWEKFYWEGKLFPTPMDVFSSLPRKLGAVEEEIKKEKPQEEMKPVQKKKKPKKTTGKKQEKEQGGKEVLGEIS
ncbi:MAG: hypothetical protein QXT05_02990 [Candidatus Bilamarchaeaceae archaeon]